MAWPSHGAARDGLRRASPSLISQAQAGRPAAQAQLGFMHATGRGVPQNFAAATYWYKRAAQQGNPTAQYLLGLAYDKGRGVPEDVILAHKWLNLSAIGAAGEEREHRIRLRDAVASKMSLREVQFAQDLATNWYPLPER